MTPLPLRDRLALDRTQLANRRTWLAYARTALALFVTGASFQQFFDVPWVRWASWAFLAASVPTLALGWVRFRQQERRMAALAAEAMILHEGAADAARSG
ncbi:MAG: DUF202 domain-containing protein [Alphaproteobacteria bacterium]|nr:DUF202 domain-containing protein [Alphaproteobacteria bacterium]